MFGWNPFLSWCFKSYSWCDLRHLRINVYLIYLFIFCQFFCSWHVKGPLGLITAECLGQFYSRQTAQCVSRSDELVLVPVGGVVEAAGRGFERVLAGSAGGGWSTEGSPAAPPVAAGWSPPFPAVHMAPPAETTNHTTVRREALRSGLRWKKTFPSN